MHAPGGVPDLVGPRCGAAITITGCNGDDEDSKPAKRTEAPQSEGIDAQPNSATAAALDFFRVSQASGWPALARAYDQRVLQTLGAREMMDGLVSMGGDLQKAPVRAADVQETPGGADSLVTLTVRLRGEDVSVSYILGQVGTRWRIRYDILLADALPAYVQSEVTDRAGRDGSVPPQAVNAGREAVSVYRGIYAPEPSTGRRIEGLVRGAGVGPRATAP